MKLGVFTVLFSGKPFEQTLEYLSGLGVQAVEIGAADIRAMLTAIPKSC